MPHKAYEITQTVKPSLKTKYIDRYTTFKEMTATEQFNWYKGMHSEIFWRDHCLETICFSEFHKNFNLHWHGIVLVPDTMTLLEIVDIRKKCLKLGLSNFKPINDLTSWNSYIRKEQSDFPEGFIIESDGYAHASVIVGSPCSTSVGCANLECRCAPGLRPRGEEWSETSTIPGDC